MFDVRLNRRSKRFLPHHMHLCLYSGNRLLVVTQICARIHYCLVSIIASYPTLPHRIYLCLFCGLIALGPPKSLLVSITAARRLFAPHLFASLFLCHSLLPRREGAGGSDARRATAQWPSRTATLSRSTSRGSTPTPPPPPPPPPPPAPARVDAGPSRSQSIAATACRPSGRGARSPQVQVVRLIDPRTGR